MKLLNCSLAFVLFSLFGNSLGKWLACTDYTEKNGDYWDPDKCRGFPRDASKFARKESFGEDVGEYIEKNYYVKHKM